MRQCISENHYLFNKKKKKVCAISINNTATQVFTFKYTNCSYINNNKNNYKVYMRKTIKKKNKKKIYKKDCALHSFSQTRTRIFLFDLFFFYLEMFPILIYYCILTLIGNIDAWTPDVAPKLYIKYGL